LAQRWNTGFGRAEGAPAIRTRSPGPQPCRSRPKPTPPQTDSPQRRSGRRQC
jgi:hypothetical protein